MSTGKPLQYGVWETHRASNRQRKSPQWSSVRQRHNYYRQYCYFWANRFGDGVTVGIQLQAVYGPHLFEHLLYTRNPFLEVLDHKRHLETHRGVMFAPVVFPAPNTSYTGEIKPPQPDEGVDDDET